MDEETAAAPALSWSRRGLRRLASGRYVWTATALLTLAILSLPRTGPFLKKAVDTARDKLPLSLPILMVLIAVVVRLHELTEWHLQAGDLP